MPSIFRGYTGADGQSHPPEEPFTPQPFGDSEGAYRAGTPLQGRRGGTFVTIHLTSCKNVSRESGERPPGPRIWIDADACPSAIKDLVLRMSRRRRVPVCLVANRPIPLPPVSLATLVRVAPEPDEVD